MASDDSTLDTSLVPDPTRRDPKYGPRYQAMRPLVKERDKNRCQTCGAKPDEYEHQVHHRMPDGHHSQRDDKRLEADHLILLCVQCHDAITNVYRSRRDCGRSMKPRPTEERIYARPAATQQTIIALTPPTEAVRARPKPTNYVVDGDDE